MDHYYGQISEESYFSYADIYRRMVEKYPSGSTFVELGVLHGQSLAFLLVEITNSGKQIQVVGVDNFKWSMNQMETVHKNLRPFSTKYKLVKDDSAAAAAMFKEKSVDLVFIDANHSYECVRADIAAWLPRIKSGGTMAGHDYEPSFPGVKQAVDEAFGDRVRFSDRFVWEVDV